MVEPFRVVCADPAWPFKDKLPEERGVFHQYKTLASGVRDIMHVAEVRSGRLYLMNQPIADDAILFLWRVETMLRDALDVIDAWGFEYKTEGIWLKKTRNGLRWFGMGHTLRAEHEAFMVAKRGNFQVTSHSERSTFVTDLDAAGISAKCEGRSDKPERFYGIVESLSGGPYLELYARRQRPGWTCIGDEIA